MTSIGSPSPFFLAGKKAYQIERSLRFNGADGSYLDSQPSSHSNKKKNTFSFWFKRAANTNFVSIFRAFGTSNNRQSLDFVSGGAIRLWGNYNGSVVMTLQTSQLFRDFSAWYHFVLVLDTEQGTASNRAKMYVNGVQITDFSNSSYPPQDFEFGFNDLNVNTQIGVPSDTQCNFYIAEFQAIDGLVLDPSYFGETDPITGQWNPKKYVGSYGTNGFYLNFADNSGTTATTLGKDSSGNGRNFTPNNFSVAAGVGNDSVSDTPTNNFCTFNPLKVNASKPIVFSEGNLQHNGVSGDNHLRSASTMQVNSGKWYVEFKFISGYEATNSTVSFGLTTDAANNRASNNDAMWYQNTDNFVAIMYRNNGTVQSFLEASSQSTLSGLPTFVNGDVMGIALDLDNDKFFVSKNGTFFSNGTGTQDPAAGTNPLYSGGYLTSRKADGFYFGVDGYSAQVVTADFGQQGFAYTPPAGFKAICTANFPDPTINFPKKHFDTVLYTGDGNATGSQTNVLEFQPDWLWSKPRTAAYAHLLYDSLRGAGNSKALNLGGGTLPGAGAEGSAGDNAVYGFLNSFDANGFSYTKGSAGTTFFNQSGINYVVWNWNAGDTDGKTYTVKVVSDSGNKYRFDDFGTSAVTLDLAEGGTYVFDQSDASNATHPLRFYTAADKTGGEYTTGVTTSGTAGQAGAYTQIVVAASAPTLYYQCSAHAGMGGQVNTNSTLGSSNFDGSTQSTVKANPTAGFSIVTYTGQQNASDTIGHGLGVKPQVVISKSRNATYTYTQWYVHHHKLTTNYFAFLNTNAAQGNGLGDYYIDSSFSSTVFAVGDDIYGPNVSNNNYVAYCFSEVAGYSKFGSYTGNGSSDGTFVFTGFRPAWIMLKRTDTSNNWHIADNKRQNPFNVVTAQIYPNLVSAEIAQSDLDIVSNGFKIRNSAAFENASGGTYIYLAFAESPFKYARAR